MFYPMTNNSNTLASIGSSKELYSHWFEKALRIDGVKTPPKLRFSLYSNYIFIVIYWYHQYLEQRIIKATLFLYGFSHLLTLCVYVIINKIFRKG